MISSSPWTSTSCWSSGEKSTWSPTFTCRTLAPTPRASPQTSRLATCAVAGIRIPPVERRSPSSLRRATRIRSCSILIGSALPLATSDGMVITVRGASSPAELVQPLVVDAEVVGDLVDHRHRHLLDHLLGGRADVADGRAVDHDPVGQRAAVLPAALGECVPLVQAQQLR